MAAIEADSGQHYLNTEKHADVPSADSQSDPEENESDDDLHSFQGVAESDRRILQEEEEREKLLSAGNNSQRQQGLHTEDSRNRRGPRFGARESGQRSKYARRKRRRQTEGQGIEEEIYEMEKGGLKDDMSSRSSSSSSELDRINYEQSRVNRVSERYL